MQQACNHYSLFFIFTWLYCCTISQYLKFCYLYPALVWRWYRFISKYYKRITSFPCICCLSSLVTIPLLGIAFILYQWGKLDHNWLICFLKFSREKQTRLRPITWPSYKQPNWPSQLQKKSIEFTYSEFPCHLEVNRHNIALINCLWKHKKGLTFTTRATSFTKWIFHS